MASLRFLKGIFLLALILLSLQEAAASIPSYYPQSFVDSFENLNDKTLKSAIRKVLVAHHWKKSGQRDVLVRSCKSKGGGSCYSQKILSYRNAREILFKEIHLERDGSGSYVKDLYCGKDFFKGKRGSFKRNLSCEHTWPRSKFSKRASWAAQESDLHHLFPVDSRANSVRGNSDFGEGGENLLGCNLSRKGKGFFEPPEEHKGNVARALFYFSVRYKMSINSKQEWVLKMWHQEDPVDEQERERNQRIYEIQKVRNPFVDLPELVGLISNF